MQHMVGEQVCNGIDTHLMKNLEWGAVAYLSHSKYGKNAEVWSNPSSNYITGQAGSSANYLQVQPQQMSIIQ